MAAEGNSWFYLCVSEPNAARVLTRQLRQELRFLAELSGNAEHGIFVSCNASGSIAYFYFCRPPVPSRWLKTPCLAIFRRTAIWASKSEALAFLTCFGETGTTSKA